ncbi:MAG: CDP-alcohol phosphatidyltransferase family protein [Spirochaetales bacterium]|nr:CDP-alcohol phosphatidyltransferase family protein [Spirochaetales bacterium]
MENNDTKRIQHLRASIYLTISLFFAAQCILFSGFAIPGGFLARYGQLFLALSAGFHVLLLVMLLLFLDDFIIESTGKKLDRVNLANLITLSRVSTLPTLLVLVLAARDYRIRIPLLVLVVLVFLTDFLDGKISRKTNQVTRVGRMMDSASDYTLLVVLSIIFQYYSIIPKWFFVLVLTRLGIQTVLIGVLILIRKRIEPKSTMMGKITVASIMVLYSVEIANMAVLHLPPFIMSSAEWIVAIIVVIGIFDKIVSFFDALRPGPPAA